MWKSCLLFNKPFWLFGNNLPLSSLVWASLSLGEVRPSACTDLLAWPQEGLVWVIKASCCVAPSCVSWFSFNYCWNLESNTPADGSESQRTQFHTLVFMAHGPAVCEPVLWDRYGGRGRGVWETHSVAWFNPFGPVRWTCHPFYRCGKWSHQLLCEVRDN